MSDFAAVFFLPSLLVPRGVPLWLTRNLPQEKFEAMWDVVDAVPYTYHLLYKPASDLKLIVLTKVSEFTSES